MLSMFFIVLSIFCLLFLYVNIIILTIKVLFLLTINVFLLLTILLILTIFFIVLSIFCLLFLYVNIIILCAPFLCLQLFGCGGFSSNVVLNFSVRHCVGRYYFFSDELLEQQTNSL